MSTADSYSGNIVRVLYVIVMLLAAGAASLFVPPAIPLTIAALLMLPVIRRLIRLSWFECSVIFFALLMSDLFLISQVVSIKRPNGENLFSIRDVTICLIIGIGLLRARRHLAETIRHPLLWPGVALTALVPSAFVIGQMNDGKYMYGLQEAFVGCCWLIPVVIAANVHGKRACRMLTNAVAVLGALVAIGTIVEAFSDESVLIVSKFRQVYMSDLTRSFPDGMHLMLVAWIVAVVCIVAGVQRAYWSALAVLITLGMALTQMRILMIASGGVLLVLAAIAVVAKRGWLKLRGMVLPGGVAVLSLGVAASIMVSQGSSTALNDSIARFGWLSQDAGGRVYELQRAWEVIQEAPLGGVGLAARYRAELDPGLRNTVSFTARDEGTFVHNIVGFYAVKYGVPGVLLFLVFCVQVVRYVYIYSRRDTPPESRVMGLGLAASLLGMLVFALSGNLFGDIKQFPVAGITLGLLVAYDRSGTLDMVFRRRQPNVAAGR